MPIMHMEHLRIMDSGLIEGVKLLINKPFEDDRGTLARIYCNQEFGSLGFNLKQVNWTTTNGLGTLRGLHYQPNQAKIVRCIAGTIFDVVVDLRPESPTKGKYFCTVLDSSEPSVAVYVPSGCAHGFQSLKNSTTVLYFLSEAYNPDKEGGVPWNDPSLNIPWPWPARKISERDKNFEWIK